MFIGFISLGGGQLFNGLARNKVALSAGLAAIGNFKGFESRIIRLVVYFAVDQVKKAQLFGGKLRLGEAAGSSG